MKPELAVSSLITASGANDAVGNNDAIANGATAHRRAVVVEAMSTRCSLHAIVHARRALG